MAPPPGFIDAVTTVIAAIPRGEVMTYGEVALEAGYPGAARAVGRVLAGGGDGLEVELPWWRVVTASGRLVPGNEQDHARLLGAEGAQLNAARTHVRMAARSIGGSRRPQADIIGQVARTTASSAVASGVAPAVGTRRAGRPRVRPRPGRPPAGPRPR